MRRSTVLGAAAAAALAAGSLAVTGVFGSSHREAPRILARPDRRQHRRLRVHGAGRSGQPDRRRQLDPVRGSGRRPVLRQARSEGALLRQDRQHRRRARGRRPTAGSSSSKFRNPNSFLYAAPTVDSVNDPDLNFVQTYDLYTRDATSNGTRDAHDADRATTCRSRPTTSGPKTIPNYDAVAAGAIRALPGGGKTFVGPADDPFFVDLGAVFDGINIDKPGRPEHRPRQPGRRQGRRRGLQHPLVRPAGARSPRSRATARPSPAPKAAQRRRRRVGDDRAPADAASLRATAASATAAPLGPGQPPRQPADQRGHHPDRPEGQVQPRRRPPTTRRTSAKYALNPEPARLLNALFGLGVKETNRTDIVQALLTGVPGLTQIGAERRPPADTLKLNLGVPPSATPEPLRRAGGRPGRLPERPPARRRRDRHRAARHRGRAADARPGRQADPARRRRRPERQAVPVARSRTSRCPTDGFDSELPSGRSRRTRRSRSRRPEPTRHEAGRRTDRGPALAPPGDPMTLVNTPSAALALAVVARLRSPRSPLLTLRGAAPSAPAAAAAALAAAARPGAGTDARDRAACRRPCAPRRARAAPRVALAGAYLQKVRETGDAALLRARRRRCCAARSRARRGDADALVARGALALSRHDFRARPALARARPRARARRARAARRRSSTRSSSSAATAPPSATLQRHGRPASRTSRPTRACPTSASCTATSPARVERDARSRSPPAAPAPENVAYVAGAARRPRARARPAGRGARARTRAALAARARATRRREAGLARLAARARRPAPARSRRWRARRRRGCRCPSTSIALGEAELAAGRARAPRGATSRSSRAAAAAARRAPASTPTSSSRSSRPTTATRRARLRARAARRGRRRRACAPPTRSAGR